MSSRKGPGATTGSPPGVHGSSPGAYDTRNPSISISCWSTTTHIAALGIDSPSAVAMTTIPCRGTPDSPVQTTRTRPGPSVTGTSPSSVSAKPVSKPSASDTPVSVGAGSSESSPRHTKSAPRAVPGSQGTSARHTPSASFENPSRHGAPQPDNTPARTSGLIDFPPTHRPSISRANCATPVGAPLPSPIRGRKGSAKGGRRVHIFRTGSQRSHR